MQIIQWKYCGIFSFLSSISFEIQLKCSCDYTNQQQQQQFYREKENLLVSGSTVQYFWLFPSRLATNFINQLILLFFSELGSLHSLNNEMICTETNRKYIPYPGDTNSIISPVTKSRLFVFSFFDYLFGWKILTQYLIHDYWFGSFLPTTKKKFLSFYFYLSVWHGKYICSKCNIIDDDEFESDSMKKKRAVYDINFSP